jgi:predicted AAA+ superfamily ATPase
LIYRKLTDQLKQLLGQYPIVALTGPRQSGKTTLLQEFFTEYRYISLENPDTRNFAEEDPRGFLQEYHSKVIFDEVQRVPALFSYLQYEVDQSRQMGQFILSGSQNFHLLEQITQSLAGRVAITKLLPFDFAELRSASLLPGDYRDLLFKGAYPPVYDRALDPSFFYENYLQTYIYRDVTALRNIQDLGRFRNFLRLCAGRAGQLLNISSLAKETGISQPTAKSWLTILESSYLIFLLPPYFKNFSKRIVKSPKLYFYDVGLLTYLLGLRSMEDIKHSSALGSLFENMVIAELYKQNAHHLLLKEFWFWRDTNQREIDLLSFQQNKYELFEIKSTQTLTSRLFKNLNFFRTLLGDDFGTSTLVYGGTDNYHRSGHQILSWQKLGN